MEMRRRPKPDGSPGYIVTLDPEHKSFKQAMICIVFTGMWFEAITHLAMVDLLGKEVARQWDRRSYRNKLQKLGCKESPLLDRLQTFVDSRNDLIHEKAHFNQDTWKTAQKESDKALEVMSEVDEFIKSKLANKRMQRSANTPADA